MKCLNGINIYLDQPRGGTTVDETSWTRQKSLRFILWEDFNIIHPIIVIKIF